METHLITVGFSYVTVHINKSFHKLSLNSSGGIGLFFIAIIVVIWLLSGIYSVEPSEQAALRMFGKYDATVESGLHWYWPWP